MGLSNCSNNYGPFHFPEKLIPVVILNALKGAPIPIYGDGQNIRDWLYVEDHADALLAVVTRGEIGRSYNIGGENEAANLDLVKTICALLDDKRPGNAPYAEQITFVADRPGHDQRYAIDPARIAAELGWRPSVTLEEGLSKTIDWYLDNEDWWRALEDRAGVGERLGLKSACARRATREGADMGDAQRRDVQGGAGRPSADRRPAAREGTLSPRTLPPQTLHAPPVVPRTVPPAAMLPPAAPALGTPQQQAPFGPWSGADRHGAAPAQTAQGPVGPEASFDPMEVTGPQTASGSQAALGPQAASGPVRMGLLTGRDSRDRRFWSGTPFYMARALDRHGGAELDRIGPVSLPEMSALRLAALVKARLTGRRMLPGQSLLAAHGYRRRFARALEGRALDVLLAPVGSPVVSHLQSDLPVIYSSDATVRLMRGYYPSFSGLSARAVREAEALEAAAIARADLLVYPTAWAARSAIADYGADPGRVHVVPYGANMDALPDRARAVAPRAEGPLRLLFVGVDWARKGGDVAIEVLDALRARGVAAHLTVVGCAPPGRPARPDLTVIPFLDKSTPGGEAELSRRYLEADLLCLPTRCECYGIVFCEASAHGVPALTRDTGGVSGVVADGVNGHVLPEAAGADAYAERIEALARDPARLAAFRRSARDHYERRLSWTIWADRILDLARDLRGQGPCP